MTKDSVRRTSLERLTSPDQLNQRLLAVSFKNWIALATLGVILFCILLWAFIGNIPVIVEGRGIVFDPQRTILVRSQTAGIVSEIHVKAGDSVEQGSLLMTLNNPQLAADLAEKQALVASFDKYIQEHPDLSLSQKEALNQQILVEKAKIDSLMLMKENERILAPESGIVVNINIAIDGSILPGTNLIWIEAHRPAHEIQHLFAIFPFESGELIKPGMKAEVALASVAREKYGLLLGTVVTVYPYFTSLDQGPFRFLPSKEIRSYLTQGGTHEGVIVAIDPNVDTQTVSGYRWSSKKGPPFPVAEGTVGSVKIILEMRKPISYLIPVTSKQDL